MTKDPDRRGSARLIPPEWPIDLSARIRPGHGVRVMNLSPRGALVESRQRLAPGRTVELQLEAAGARHATRARVVRCYVSAVAADIVMFRGALAFERPVPWLGRSEALTVEGT